MRENICGKFWPCKPGVWTAIGAATYIFLSFVLVALYFMMRQLTTSSERFRGIPGFAVAIHLALCAALLVALSGRTFRAHSLLLRFSVAVFAIALLLTLSSAAMSLWLAARQEALQLCLIDEASGDCKCRNDLLSDSTSGWSVYDEMKDCRELDSLFRLLVSNAVVLAFGAVLCLLSIIFISYLSCQPIMDRDPCQEIALEDRHSAVRALWRRLFPERVRPPLCPPSYEESQRTLHPPPEYNPS